jgi:hypothetical protein
LIKSSRHFWLTNKLQPGSGNRHHNRSSLRRFEKEMLPARWTIGGEMVSSTLLERIGQAFSGKNHSLQVIEGNLFSAKNGRQFFEFTDFYVS